jgi:hypothetical protein
MVYIPNVKGGGLVGAELVDRFKPAPDGCDPIIFTPIEFGVIPLIMPECSECRLSFLRLAKCEFEFDNKLEQGNLLRGIDNKTEDQESYFVYICSLLSCISKENKMVQNYSNADSGVIFKFLQNPPIVKVYALFFFSYLTICILIFLRENKEISCLQF